jgi:hypothetical protein
MTQWKSFLMPAYELSIIVRAARNRDRIPGGPDLVVPTTKSLPVGASSSLIGRTREHDACVSLEPTAMAFIGAFASPWPESRVRDLTAPLAKTRLNGSLAPD